LQDTEAKLIQAKKNLSFAVTNFENAKVKAEEIRNQGSIISSKTIKTLLENIDRDIQRLQMVSLSVVNFEQEKSINEVVYNHIELFCCIFNLI
jgi:hypothetical protein